VKKSISKDCRANRTMDIEVSLR